MIQFFYKISQKMFPLGLGTFLKHFRYKNRVKIQLMRPHLSVSDTTFKILLLPIDVVEPQ